MDRLRGLRILRRELLLEPAEHIVCVEPHALSVGPHECSPEDASRPPRDVVRFKAFEQGEGDLRVLGNALERQTSALAFATQVSSECSGFGHQLRIIRDERVQAEYASR
jgi:hypothetical protein